MKTVKVSGSGGSQLKPLPSSKNALENSLYILATLEQDRINTLIRPFFTLEEARAAFDDLESDIRAATRHRDQVIGYPINSVSQESAGLARWDNLRLEGEITEQEYRLSMWSIEEVCILYWDTVNGLFRCVSR